MGSTSLEEVQKCQNNQMQSRRYIVNKEHSSIHDHATNQSQSVAGSMNTWPLQKKQEVNTNYLNQGGPTECHDQKDKISHLRKYISFPWTEPWVITDVSSAQRAIYIVQTSELKANTNIEAYYVCQKDLRGSSFYQTNAAQYMWGSFISIPDHKKEPVEHQR